MLSSNDIKNVRLGKALFGGYKVEEVELLLNKIASDYEEYESLIKKFRAKLGESKVSVEKPKNEKVSKNDASAKKSADNSVEKTKNKTKSTKKTKKKSSEG